MTHGTRGAYVRGCRCADCKRAHCTYVKSYNATHRGYDSVPAAPFTAVFGALYRAGEDVRRIMEVTGLSSTTVLAITMGERERIWRGTAKKARRVVEMIP